MEICGLIIENKELIGAAVGALIGALLTAYTCYVVSKVKHDYEIRDEANERALMNETMESWRLEKSGTWYKGYKLALVSLLVLSAAAAMATVIIVMQYGYASGAVECTAVGFVAAILEGLVLDKKVIHPIADGEFMEKVETPLVDAFLHPPSDAAPAEEIDPSVIAVAREMKKRGLI